MWIRCLLVAGLILGCASVAGCVRTDTEMLDSSTAMISARGTAFDTPATVLKATRVAAAKVAQSRGFRYFAIVSVQDATRTATIYTPPQTHSYGTMTGTVSPYGNVNATYTDSTYATPGSVETLIKPGSDVVIRFFREGEVDPRAQGICDVESVLAEADYHFAPPPTLAVVPAGAVQAPLATTAPSTQVVAPTVTAPSPSSAPFQSFNDWQKSHGN